MTVNANGLMMEVSILCTIKIHLCRTIATVNEIESRNRVGEIIIDLLITASLRTKSTMCEKKRIYSLLRVKDSLCPIFMCIFFNYH